MCRKIGALFTRACSIKSSEKEEKAALNEIWHHSVWKSQKKSHSTLRAKGATFTFWVDKRFIKNAKKSSILAEACGQTVLPDRLLLKGQKLVENA